MEWHFTVDTQIGVNLVHATSTELKTVLCIGIQKHFYYYWCPAKLIHACLRVSMDNESSFKQSGVPVKLVQASLGVRKDAEHSFQLCGGLERSFHNIWRSCETVERHFRYEERPRKQSDHYGRPVKLVHTSIGARKGIERNFSTSEVQLSSYMFVCV